MDFARERCLPYLAGLPVFRPYLERLAFVLVGSAATGACGRDSDVDIAVVCDAATCDIISAGTPWREGRPSEVMLDGVQLHYYAISLEEVEARLRDLDDGCMYVYGNGIVLSDPGELYAGRIAPLSHSNAQVRKARIEGKLDMLLRRARALDDCLTAGEIHPIGCICLELASLCLKVTALLDDVQFDPRKRLFSTALSGRTGRRIEEGVRGLYAAIGELGSMREAADFRRFSFPGELGGIIRILAGEAETQGYCVGLANPDHRHIE